MGKVYSFNSKIISKAAGVLNIEKYIKEDIYIYINSIWHYFCKLIRQDRGNMVSCQTRDETYLVKCSAFEKGSSHQYLLGMV